MDDADGDDDDDDEDDDDGDDDLFICTLSLYLVSYIWCPAH